MRLVARVPAWVPAPAAAPYVAGVVLVGLGLAILSGRGVRVAASIVIGLLVLLLAVVNAPQVAASPMTGFLWTNPLKQLALIGGALILMGRDRTRETVAAVLLAAFLVLAGLQHYVYRGFVDTLVPAWIPPGQRFWTLFTGVALLAGGIGILVPRTAGLASRLAALMIALWVVLLHIPRAVAEGHLAGESAGVLEALAVSGVALLVAGTRPATE